MKNEVIEEIKMNRIVAIAGPSGSGKSELAARICEKFKNTLDIDMGSLTRFQQLMGPRSPYRKFLKLPYLVVMDEMGRGTFF